VSAYLPKTSETVSNLSLLNLGMLGHMSATRDINAAWNEAKRKAAKEYPEKFILAGLNSTIKKKNK